MATHIVISDSVTIESEVAALGERDFTSYDAYLGEQGLLFYTGQESVRVTETRPLEPARLDVGNRPFEIRPESGNFFGQGDFSGGQGQRWAHRPGADETGYLYSEGFDISVPGKLTHLNQTAAHGTTISGSGKSSVIGGALFVANGNDVTRIASLTGAATTENPHAGETATAVHDIASTGTEGYFALGANGIHHRDAAGTYTHYSDVQATRIMYYRETRLIATDGLSLYEVLAGGAAPTAILTLTPGWTFTDITNEGRFIYASAVSTGKNQSRIYIFALKADVSGIEQKGFSILPDGELAYSLKGHLGVVYIGVGVPNRDGGKDPGFYRANVTDDGFLGLEKLAQGKGATTDLSVTALGSEGRFVLLGWSLGAGSAFGSRTGIAIFDPARGAFSHHYYSELEGAPAKVNGISVFEGKRVFVTTDVWYPTDLYEDAFLISSMGNWNSSGLKSWDLFEVAHRALPTGTKVELQYTPEQPEEDIWFSAGTSTIPFSKGAEFQLTDNQPSRLLAVKLVSSPTSDRTLAPEIESFSVRSHPTTAKPEFRLQRTIQLFAEDRKDPGGREVRQDPRAVRDFLRDNLLAWFTWYEPDATYTVRMTGYREITPDSPLYEETKGESNKQSFYMVLQLDGTLA